MKLRVSNKIYRNLYILTLCIAMFGRLGNVSTPWWMKYIHCFIWIALFLYRTKGKILLNENNHLIRCMVNVQKIFTGFYIIFWLFTPIGYLIYYEDMSLRMFTRAISTTIQMFLIIWSVYATAFFFKEKLIKYTFIALAINYSIIIILALVLCGIDDFITYGLFPFTNAADSWSAELKSSKVLEVHDVTFAAGFFFIYSIIWRNKIEHKNWMLLGCLVLLYFGWKRTEILGCLLLVVAAIFIRNKSTNSINFWNAIYSLVIIGICFIWIWLIDSGFYHTLIDDFGINFNSRDKAYDFMGQLFSLTPFYIGRGMSAAIITNQDAIAGGVQIIQGHSDVMFSYIDYGFWGFLIWLLYSTWFVTRWITKLAGKDTAKTWMLFTAYAFITYLTDNTLTYFAFQTSYMVIIFHMMYTYKKLSSVKTLNVVMNRYSDQYTEVNNGD